MIHFNCRVFKFESKLFLGHCAQNQQEIGTNKVAIKTCCFCLEIRTGCTVLAIVEIMGGIADVFIESFIPPINDAHIAVAFGVIGIALFLVYGTSQNNQIATFLYLVFTGSGIVTFIAKTIMDLIEVEKFGIEKEGYELMAILGNWTVVLFMLSIIKVYPWLCAYSFLQELMERKYDPID